MTDAWVPVVWVGISFFLGSVSVGDIVSKFVGVDIRSLGTGNPGAANFYREVGPVYGIWVFSLDVVKGGIVTVPLFLLGEPSWIRAVSVTALMAGHLTPMPWKRSAGTGMAVVMGTTSGLLPIGGFLAAPIAFLVLKFTKSTSYTGTTFFVGSFVIGWIVHRDVLSAVTLFAAAVIIFIKAQIQYRDQ